MRGFFGAGRRPIVFAVHDASSGLGCELQAGAPDDLSARLCRGLVFRHGGGVHGLGDLAGGKLGEGGEDEFGLAQVVAEIPGLELRALN